MNKQKGISTLIVIIIIIVVAVVSAGGVLLYQYLTTQQPTVCTKEAKFCPDGSNVYRTGPNCEFAECPIIKEDLSKLNKDELLHKLFPNLTFNNGIANLPNISSYQYGLNLHLQESKEDYFINSQEKNLLLIVKLDGVAHAGGLYHSYLGVFDKNGNLLTPSSPFGSADYLEEVGGFNNDKAHFGADEGEFNFYDCDGVKYILFVSHGCPNGSCCSGGAGLFKINNGVFEKVQTVTSTSLGNPSYNLKVIPSIDGISIKRVPATSDTACPQTNYKELKWNKDICRFE